MWEDDSHVWRAQLLSQALSRFLSCRRVDGRFSAGFVKEGIIGLKWNVIDISAELSYPLGMQMPIIIFHLQIYCLLTWGMYECLVSHWLSKNVGIIFMTFAKTRKMTHMCDGRNFFPRLSLASSLVVGLRDPGRTWSCDLLSNLKLQGPGLSSTTICRRDNYTLFRGEWNCRVVFSRWSLS